MNILTHHLHRARLQQQALRYAKHPLAAIWASLERGRNSLTAQLEIWLPKRAHHMPWGAPEIARYQDDNQSAEVEDSRLWLPSEFSSQLRKETKDLVAHLDVEYNLRKCQIVDIAGKLKTNSQFIRTSLDRKTKQDRGQRAHTQSWNQIEALEWIRDELLAAYDIARIRMIAIDPQSSQIYHRLTPRDVYMKSVNVKRALGDSKVRDGLLFFVGTSEIATFTMRPKNEDLPATKPGLWPTRIQEPYA